MKGLGGAEHWYGGLDNPEHKEQIERLFHAWEILKNGGRISDEEGTIALYAEKLAERLREAKR